jgi:aromatic ring-cleaving dioxygenase
MIDATTIRGFHVHVYFDTGTRGIAERLHEGIETRFDAKVGKLHGQPVGPHPKPMFEVTATPEQFASIVTWLMLNREGLSVLVHPVTDDAIADHETRTLWMGESLPLDVDFVRRYVAERAA